MLLMVYITVIHSTSEVLLCKILNASKCNIYSLFNLPLIDIGCSINLNTNSPKNPPHIVYKNQIVQPILQEGNRILTLTDKVTIACTGTGNTLTATGEQINTATCASDTSLFVNGKKHLFQ